MRKLIILILIISTNLSYSNSINSPEKGKNKHYIGELFGGGIIFYIYTNAKGEQHGLRASLNNLAIKQRWGFYLTNVPNCSSMWNGEANTKAVIEFDDKIESAAKLCYDYKYKEYEDWYLPAIDELKLIFDNRYIINRVLELDEDPETELLQQKYYWSSSHISESHAWYYNMGAGISDDGSKKNLSKTHVRAIRYF